MGQMATDKMTRAFAAARAPPPSLARWRRATSRANAHDASRARRVAAAAAIVVSSDPPPPTDPPSSSEPSGAHRDNDASRASRATAAPPPSPRRRIAPGGAKRGDNAQRDEWADAVVSSHSGGRVSKRAFEAHLGAVADLALSDVAVILVGTKKAGNVGAIARACGAFECEDLRLVAPRADPYTRASLSAAKGAQHIVHGAGVYDDVEDALRGCDAAIAFHRWHEGCAPRAVTDVAELLRSFPGDSGGTGGSAAGSGDDGGESTLSSRRNASEEGVTPPEAVEEWDWSSPAQVAKDAAAAAAAAAFLEGLETPEDKALSHAERERREHGWRRRRHATPPRNRAGRGRKRLALVFGREVEGLFDDECDAVCSIPTGRLIESLSVSHAAVIILSQYYQARVGGGGGGVA